MVGSGCCGRWLGIARNSSLEGSVRTWIQILHYTELEDLDTYIVLTHEGGGLNQKVENWIVDFDVTRQVIRLLKKNTEVSWHWRHDFNRWKALLGRATMHGSRLLRHTFSCITRHDLLCGEISQMGCPAASDVHLISQEHGLSLHTSNLVRRFRSFKFPFPGFWASGVVGILLNENAV